MLTDTKTCQTMNAVYELTKLLSVEDLKAMSLVIETEHAENGRHLMLYCIKETLRRKNKGIWA